MKRLYRFIGQCRIAIEGHLLNPLWHSKDERRRKRHKVLEKVYMNYLKSYKDFAKNIIPECKEPSEEEEKVFTIWFQGEENAPELIKACFRSMRANLKQELIVLDEQTIFDWISLPEHIIDKWKQGLISRTHFSDICRVELLYSHGGFWLDSTCFATGPVPQEIVDSDFFVYMAQQRKFTFIQNCFIRAKQYNPLIDIWRRLIYEYWHRESELLDYYTHQLLFCFCVKYNSIASKLFEIMPKIDQNPTHELWHGGFRDLPFELSTFNQLTQNSFFHKTSYKHKSASEPISGSFAEYIINFGKNKSDLR